MFWLFAWFFRLFGYRNVTTPEQVNKPSASRKGKEEGKEIDFATLEERIEEWRQQVQDEQDRFENALQKWGEERETMQKDIQNLRQQVQQLANTKAKLEREADAWKKERARLVKTKKTAASASASAPSTPSTPVSSNEKTRVEVASPSKPAPSAVKTNPIPAKAEKEEDEVTSLRLRLETLDQSNDALLNLLEKEREQIMQKEEEVDKLRSVLVEREKAKAQGGSDPEHGLVDVGGMQAELEAARHQLEEEEQKHAEEMAKLQQIHAEELEKIRRQGREKEQETSDRWQLLLSQKTLEAEEEAVNLKEQLRTAEEKCHALQEELDHLRSTLLHENSNGEAPAESAQASWAPARRTSNAKPLIPLGSARTTSAEGSTDASAATAGASPLLSDAEREKNAAARMNLVREIVSSEESYVDSLGLIIKIFARPLQKAAESGGFISTPQVNSIFGTLEDIYRCNSKLLSRLKQRLAEWEPSSSLMSDIFLSCDLEPHIPFMIHYMTSFYTLQEVTNIPEGGEFLRACRSHPELRNRDLSDFMIMPVQRLPRYIMLLENLYKKTEDNHPDKKGLKEAYTKIREITDAANEKKRERDKIVDIWQATGVQEILSSEERTSVLEGELLHENGKKSKNAYCYLLNDRILYSEESDQGIASGLLGKKTGRIYKRWSLLPLDGTAKITGAVPPSFTLSLPDGSYTFSVQLLSDFDKWAASLQKVFDDLRAPKARPKLHWSNKASKLLPKV